MDKKLEEMRKESKTLIAKVTVGKNGLSEGTIKTIRDKLRTERMVKVKILKAFIEENDKNKIFDELVEKCEAKVVHKLGFTITLTRGL